MSAAALRARYLGDQITTASPQRLLVMLYDRLALDLERAHTALTEGDRQEANTQLQHAQEIVLELHASLRVDIWDGGPRLAAIYTWLHAELIRANLRGNARIVADCQRIVEPLRDAWREAAASLASGTA
jgi:flagellar secretion chaperone FliS